VGGCEAVNNPVILKLKVPYPIKGEEVLVDMEVKISPMYANPYYAKRHKRYNKWDVHIVEVPEGWYPNEKQRKVLSKSIYNEIVKAGYDIPKATTAIGNKIIERYDGDI
jgi:hypothetical protein